MSSGDSDNDSRQPTAKDGKSEEIFEVEKVLDHKVTDDAFLLKVRWAGYGSEDDSWEPEEDIKECADEVVKQYYTSLKVNDKTELIETLQKKIKVRNTTSKKRERAPVSDADDATDSDGSYASARNSKKSKKSSRKESSSSSKHSKAASSSAVKFSAASPSSSGMPNKAKQAAQNFRGLLYSSDSDDESVAPASDIDIIRKKIKNKSEASESNIKESLERKQQSASPQPCSSSSYDQKKKQSAVIESNDRHRTLDIPVTDKEVGTKWTVEGITRLDERKNKEKLVLMINNETNERKVINPEEAFKLDGWALTKYLLDRCEF